MVEKIIPFILMKTQHHYSNIREFAMKTLAALILEDYLKFRGNLLVYVLAGILDQEREIKELSIELIMKYTLEKSDIFLRTCLLECPFVFNGCPCFGQGNSGLSRTGNILKGAAKKPAREFIYQYLIKKIEPVYLYMYFSNMSRMHEFIQKDPTIAQSIDLQSSIADFLYICSEVCIANEKQKKNLEKIVKESHDGEGIAVNDDDDLGANEPNPELAAASGDGEKRGRGGKKGMPTLTQSLSAVEKIVPFIASIDEVLRPMNESMFAPVLDRLCMNMCAHFESLIEYAQPRKFWSKHLNAMKKAQSAMTTPKQPRKNSTKVTKEMQPPPAPSIQPETSRTRKDKENDSGHFTLEDNEVDEVMSKRRSSRASIRCASQASGRSVSLSNRSVSRVSNRSAISRAKKRLESIQSDDGDESDTSSQFSELSIGTAVSSKRRNSQKETPSRKRNKRSPSKTPSTRKSPRR